METLLNRTQLLEKQSEQLKAAKDLLVIYRIMVQKEMNKCAPDVLLRIEKLESILNRSSAESK